MIKMNCPHCGHQLRIRSKFAGRQGQCKHCEGVIDVPNTYAEAADEPDEGPANDVGTLSTKMADATALADLLADDDPQPVEPPPGLAEPPSPAPGDPEKSTKILARAESFKPLGCLYWLLVIFLTPAALIWGIVLPSGHPQKKLAIVVPIALMLASVVILLVVFVALPVLLLTTLEADGNNNSTGISEDGSIVITPAVVDMEVSPHQSVTLQTNSPSGMANDLSWRSSDPSIAKVISHSRSAMVYGMAPGTAIVTAENIMSGQQATATINVSPASAPAAVTASQLYSDSGLPRYPRLTMEIVDLSENELSGPLAQANPSELTTYAGHVREDFETVTRFFYEELEKRGWIIDDYGYGDTEDGETFIIGSKEGVGLEYNTSRAVTRTRVVITIGPLN
jgi:hypothetical protein